MQVTRPVGRDAAAKKYDILSALMAHGLAGDQHRQRLTLRLAALITTRYNWQRDELTIGQREIARLWCVDERTVKRDMARLRELGWIIVKRQGARGRVSVLGLDLTRLMLDTKPAWPHIGPDFQARMGGPAEAAEQGAANVVPFRRDAARPFDEGMGTDDLWSRMRPILRDEDPALFDAWLAPLRADPGAGGPEAGGQGVRLCAPSRFHATYVRTHLMARLSLVARRCEPSAGPVRVDPPGSRT